jgi:pimeloyl-ACP methyl ester carboxylesterase
MRVVTVPGFADTSRYWSDAIGSVFPVAEIVTVEWPGLWGASESSTPVASMVAQVADLVDAGTVLVGHSFGARVVLAAAQVSTPAGLVLVAPALSELSFLSNGELDRWRGSGRRWTTRPDPVSGAVVELNVPVAFADDALVLVQSPLVLPAVPCCVVCLSDDVRQNTLTGRHFNHDAVVLLDGPHRFWEDPAAFTATGAAVATWAAETFADQ